MDLFFLTLCLFRFPQGNIDDSFELKIHKRHRRVDHLTRSCSENEQGEVSALFREKQQNR